MKKVRKRVIGGMSLLFLLIAMACPAYAALWSDESTGVLKQTNKDAGNPADETEQVETEGANDKAVIDYNMHTKNGDFYVNINGADGVNSRIHIKAVFDSTNEKSSQNVKLTIASDSVNNHGVHFINDRGTATNSISVPTVKGSTTEPERAEKDSNGKYITGKNSAGSTVYRELNYTVVSNIQFQYTKEAYTYATGSGTVTNGTSRMNDRTWDWTNTGTSTLNGANGVYHSAHKETFSLQVNMANMNVYKSPTTVIGEYTVSLKHPTVAVTYKGNGATSGSSKTQSFNYNETKGIYTVGGKKLGFKKPGYKPNPGKQWNTKANGTGTVFSYDGSKKYAATELVNFTDGEKFTQKKLKLYAQWIAGTPTEEPEEETVTVTYHSRYPDGTDIVVTDEVLKNSNYTVKTYEQCGFYPPAGYAVGTSWTTATGFYPLSPGYTIQQIVSDYELYAYWQVNPYTIHFDANGGSGSMDDMVGLQRNVSYNLTKCAFTSPNKDYTFIGWSKQPNSKKASYQDQASVMNLAPINSNYVTLYAVWAKPYQVKYIDGIIGYGGNVAQKKLSVVRTDTCQYYTHYNIPAITLPEREGYEFVGWGSQETADEVTEYDLNYAKALTDKIPGTDQISMVWIRNIVIHQNKVKRTDGYYFGTEFYLTPNGRSAMSSVTYDAQQDCNVVSLYAIWKKLPTYDIKFEKNQPSNAKVTGNMEPMRNCRYDTEYTLTANNFVCTSTDTSKIVKYKFMGWATTPTWYQEYKKEHGRFSPSNNSMTDYSIEGTWYKDCASIEQKERDGGGDITLYAQWAIAKEYDSYDILFKPNGASGYITGHGDYNSNYNSMKKLAFDTQYDLPNPQHTGRNQLAYTDKNGTEQKIKFGYTWNNYIFTGWNTKADGTGISFPYMERDGFVYKEPTIQLSEIFDKVEFQAGNQLVLYAQWKYDGYVVHYNANGGTGSMDDVTLTSDYPFTVVKECRFSRTAYKFVYWTLNADGTGEKYRPGEGLNVRDILRAKRSDGNEITLYAQWKYDRYVVHYNANGGTGSMDDVTLTSDYLFTVVKECRFSKNAYMFVYWTLNADGTGKKYRSGEVLDVREILRAMRSDGNEITLYAQWKVAEAAYTARHWKQKAEGNAAIHNSDNYDLAETETGKAQIGTNVTPPVKTYAGFVSPAVQTGTVTEDGKLVIDYFYERQFYSVTLHAGTGIETVLGGGAYRYGQSVTIDASLKTGYHWSHWTGSFDQDTKNYTFTMPMSNVELTANGEANKYTIHFDPNGGAGHIDDIIATYDTDITLPDIWKADGTAAYEKYTLDGVNVTGDVISGAIPRSMMAGYEEEEPEDDEDTSDDAEEAEQAKAAENNAANAKEDKAADDTEELEDTKKAAEPVKKVYASVFMGWALEDGKDSFIPKWKAGDVVQNLVAEDGGEITLYAVWDDCPWIRAEDLYYTLDQAQSGFITEAEILSHATASDREDGSPIAPGTNPAASDPSLYTSFTIPDYQAGEFTSLQHDFATSENLTVVDHVGNTYVKQIMVHVTDTTPKKITQMDLTGVTRFINSKYYKKPFEEGGLEDNSIWKVDPEYKAALESALNNMDNDTPVETYVFSKETIKKMKQYVETHGIGNSKEPDALRNFYNLFLAPNKK